MTTAAFVVSFVGALLLTLVSRLGTRESVRAQWAWFGLEAALIAVVFGSFWWMHDNGTDVVVPFVLFALLIVVASRSPGARGTVRRGSDDRD